MRKTFLAAIGAAILALSATAVQAQTTVSVAIGGRSIVTFLPFTIADSLGYFKQEGLAVKINDFRGGSNSVEALVGGSADFALGGLDHPIYLQAKGIDIKAVALMTRSYGAVLALKPELAKKYKSPKDLQGLKIGVPAPGSSLAKALDILLAKVGLPDTAATKIGIGGGPGAVAAARSGRVDGLFQGDPMIAVLVADGVVVPVVDARTEEGIKYLYGGPIAATVVLTTPEMIKTRRPVVEKFVKAIVHALTWLHTATPEQVAAAVPESYYFGQGRKFYEGVIERAHLLYSTDGRITLDAAKRTYEGLAVSGILKTKKIDVAKTFDASFVTGK